MSKPRKFVVLEEYKEVWFRGSWITGLAIKNGLFDHHFPGYTIRMCQGFELDRLLQNPDIRERWSL